MRNSTVFQVKEEEVLQSLREENARTIIYFL